MSTVVFLGDSITLGVRPGVTAAQTFASIVGNARGFSSIINKGLSNDTAAGGLARLNADVISLAPKSCVVMFGTNDVFNGVSVASYKASMKSIVQQLKAAGIEVVILSPLLGRSSPQIAAFPPYLIALEEIGFEESVHVIDIYRRITHDYFYFSSTDFNNLYLDWAHPSAIGHTRIANIILEKANNGRIIP
jgi:lysophospholipase L1-like esterase